MGPEVIILTTLFAAIFGIVYIIVTARHRQRMALIEKGMDPGNWSAGEKSGRSYTLKFGLLMVGIGVGILMGYGLSWVMPPHPSPYDEDPGNPVPYFFSILLCGGAALIIDHVLARKRKG
ncbi:MAG: hypothetical protein JNM91_14590 [Flavobacteriales bacterium]|nr:hypothetical protein [Flavobacteriales bacterium]